MKLLKILASYIIFVLLFSSIGICQVCLVDAYTYNERDKRILCIDCDTGKEWALPYTGHLVDCEYKTYTVCIADESKQCVYILDSNMSIVEEIDISSTNAEFVTGLRDNNLFYITNNPECVMKMMDLNSLETVTIDISAYICEGNITYLKDTTYFGEKCISYSINDGVLFSDIYEFSDSIANRYGIFNYDKNHELHYICAGYYPMWIDSDSFLYLDGPALYKYDKNAETPVIEVINIWEAFKKKFILYDMEVIYCSNKVNDNCVTLACIAYDWFKGPEYVLTTVNFENGSHSEYIIKTKDIILHPGFVATVH